MQPIPISNIAIILVTYNPNLAELEINIATYINQVSLLIIVDNSTQLKIQEDISLFVNETPNSVLIQNKANLGIAEAQNLGINYAIDGGYDFILEMDQDSLLSPSYVRNLYDSYLILINNSKNVALISGIPIAAQNGEVYGNLKVNMGCYSVDKTLSSGSLIPCNVLKAVGFKDSKLFIDLVDWDWCWQAKKLGYVSYINSDLVISHHLGEKHIGFLGLKIGVPQPFRHYYAFRNSLYLMSKKYVPFIWKVKTVFLLCFKLLVYPLLLPNGKERLYFMNRGMLDFFSNKLGKISTKA